MNAVCKLLLLFILSLTFNISRSQINIEVKNTEIEDVSSFTISLENTSEIKLTNFKTKGKFLIVNEMEYKKIRVSFLGYYDTTLIIEENTKFYEIKLKQKIHELEEVKVNKFNKILLQDKREMKGQNLLFNLGDDKIWYFYINVNKYDLKKLFELYVELDNVCKEDILVVGFYLQIDDALIGNHFFTDTINLNQIKDNFLKIFDYTKNDLSINENFYASFQVIPIKKNRPKKATALVTKFQDSPNQILYQSNKGFLHKMPMNHYLQNFKGYPDIVKSMLYGK